MALFGHWPQAYNGRMNHRWQVHFTCHGTRLTDTGTTLCQRIWYESCTTTESTYLSERMSHVPPLNLHTYQNLELVTLHEEDA